jgi:hypothetical protein
MRLRVREHVAEIDAYAVDDASVLGRLGIALDHQFCIARAHSTAATTEGNSDSSPSPVV